MFTEGQKENAPHYMAHTTAVAKQHYRMLVPEPVIATAALLDSLSGASNRHTIDHSSTSADFTSFTTTFTVTTNGQLPSKRTQTNARLCDDKWWAQQYVLRENFCGVIFH